MCCDNRLICKPQKEEDGLIITINQKCNNGKCDFCSINRKSNSHLKTIEDINKDIKKTREEYGKVKHIFIFNNSKLFEDFSNFKNILINIKSNFLECIDFTICSELEAVLKLSQAELYELKKFGINNMNVAIETGSDRILQHLEKTINQEDIINMGEKVKASAIKLSLCITSGIGGKDRWIEHALESAKVINEIDPDCVRLLAFNYEKGSFISKEISNGSFIKLSPKQTLLETKKLIEHIETTKCIFKSSNSYNYLAINGVLPKDKETILKYLEVQISKI